MNEPNKIAKIGNAKLIDEILAALEETADSTEELVVLRAYRDTETGEKQLEWFTTRIESRVWIIGALNYLSYKMHNDSEGWDE
ncbi:MAG: hypothetical protein V3U60_11230 [Gammaproteobacteria bacterium]